MIRRKQLLVIFTISMISSSLVCNKITIKETKSEIFFALIAKYHEHAIKHNDILQLIKQYLALIQIHLEIIPTWWMGDGDSLIGYSDYDLLLISTTNRSGSVFDTDPFGYNRYNENGSRNFSYYHTDIDWDENLGTGRNEWYIQTGKNMDNTSQEALDYSWQWQYYLMDEILPCLPLFKVDYDNYSSFHYLIFNMKESRDWTGRRDPVPGYPEKSQGLVLRKAISYAINREEIRRVVFGDECEIYEYPINPSSTSWLNPNIFRYCCNLKVAWNFMYVLGIILGWNTDWGGYDPWPDWEDVCNRNTTPTANGYKIGITILCLTFSTISYLYLKRRKRSKND